MKQVMVGRLGDGHRPSRLELIRTLTVGVGQQWKAIARLQAVMSLLEGYSNLVMNEVGRRALPHFALLEGAYRRRQQERTGLAWRDRLKRGEVARGSQQPRTQRRKVKRIGCRRAESATRESRR